MTGDVQMVVQTRYSYFGASGWRSPTSKDKELLFDPVRLNKRLALFEKMNLASLRDQTDPDFRLVVLTSADLPGDHLARLREACNDLLGEARCRILRRAPGSAGKLLRRYMRNALAGPDFSAQIVLDDDDALSADFIARCRTEAVHARTQFRPGQDCVYLSFATGYTGLFHEDGGLDLIHRDTPYTNLGLTLVAPTQTDRNPYMLAHKKVARRHDVRVFQEQRPFYIRAVHDSNDSRAQRGDAVLDAAAVARARDVFPLLRDLDLVALRDGTHEAA